MAYPNYYYPVNYQQFQPQMNLQGTPMSPSNQSAQFVRVRSEHEARMWPVAPGNSVTFIDENAPYCYTKTVDMSQLDRPRFERYRLVKEEPAPEPAQAPVPPVGGLAMQDHRVEEYALKSELVGLQKQVEKLERRLNNVKSADEPTAESDADA